MKKNDQHTIGVLIPTKLGLEFLKKREFSNISYNEVLRKILFESLLTEEEKDQIEKSINHDSFIYCRATGEIKERK